MIVLGCPLHDDPDCAVCELLWKEHGADGGRKWAPSKPLPPAHVDPGAVPFTPGPIAGERYLDAIDRLGPPAPRGAKVLSVPMALPSLSSWPPAHLAKEKRRAEILEKWGGMEPLPSSVLAVSDLDGETSGDPAPEPREEAPGPKEIAEAYLATMNRIAAVEAERDRLRGLVVRLVEETSCLDTHGEFCSARRDEPDLGGDHEDCDCWLRLVHDAREALAPAAVPKGGDR